MFTLIVKMSVILFACAIITLTAQLLVLSFYCVIHVHVCRKTILTNQHTYFLWTIFLINNITKNMFTIKL